MTWIFYARVVFPINSVRWLTCLFLFTPVHFSPSRTQYGGRKGEENPGGSSMEERSGGGESHLVGDIIINVKCTTVKATRLYSVIISSLVFRL